MFCNFAGASQPTAAQHLAVFTEGEYLVTSQDQIVTDPVCNMRIKQSDAVATVEYEGRTYYFCSQDCADSFQESPEDYL